MSRNCRGSSGNHSAEGGRLATRALPWAAQIQTRSRSRRRQAWWRFRGGRAAPRLTQRVSRISSAGASGRGQPARTAASAGRRDRPIQASGGGPRYRGPWGASASSSFRPVSTPGGRGPAVPGALSGVFDSGTMSVRFTQVVGCIHASFFFIILTYTFYPLICLSSI